MGRPRADTRGVGKEQVISQHVSAHFLAEQYEDVRELGSGSYGRVRLVRDRESRQERVLKIISTHDMARPIIDMTMKEIELLLTLDHPLIVKLFEFAEDVSRQEILLVLEYLPGVDGVGFVAAWSGDEENLTRPSEQQVAGLVQQLLVALHYCHVRGVVHRDVKPENLMIVDAAEPRCKLIDFGLAGRSLAGDGGLLSDCVGTPKYMAPEVHRQVPYSSKADIWSVGCTALHLLLGEAPFKRPYEVSIGRYQSFEELEARLEQLPAWRRLSEEARDFARCVLQANPDLRPRAADALRHTWFRTCELSTAKLTKEMARSLVGYTGAPPVLRCCMFSIATRTVVPNMEGLSAAFLRMDADFDGLISHEDLQEAVADMEGSSSWWSPRAEVDIDKLLNAADLNHNGRIGFTEFLAACSLGSRWSLDDISREAFRALDSDRDGLLRVKEIEGLFRERDGRFLRTLPQNQPFGVEEWCELVDGCSPASGASSASGTTSPPTHRDSSPWPFGFFLEACSAPRDRTFSNASSDISLGSPLPKSRSIFS